MRFEIRDKLVFYYPKLLDKNFPVYLVETFSTYFEQMQDNLS